MGPVNDRGSCTWIAPLHVFNTALNGWSFLVDICYGVAAKRGKKERKKEKIRMENRERERKEWFNFTYRVEVDFPVLRV